MNLFKRRPFQSVDRTKYCPHMVIVNCEKCGGAWFFQSDKLDEERTSHRWKHKWSWSKFRHIWLCFLCVADAELLSWQARFFRKMLRR